MLLARIGSRRADKFFNKSQIEHEYHQHRAIARPRARANFSDEEDHHSKCWVPLGLTSKQDIAGLPVRLRKRGQIAPQEVLFVGPLK